MCALTYDERSNVSARLGCKEALLLEDDTILDVWGEQSLAVRKHVFRVILDDELEIRELLQEVNSQLRLLKVQNRARQSR